MKKILTLHNARPQFTPHPLIAHRGLHGNDDIHRKGNKLEFLLAALNNGFGIEFDVQLLNDDTLVIYHNFETDDGTRLSDQTIDQFRENIRSEGREVLTMETLFEHIVEVPTLSDMGMCIDLEIKGDIQFKNNISQPTSPTLGPKVASCLSKLISTHPSLKPHVFVTSFNDPYITSFKDAFSKESPDESYMPPTGVLACLHKGRKYDRHYEGKTDAQIFESVAERVKNTGSQFCVLEAALAKGRPLDGITTLLYGVPRDHCLTTDLPCAISDHLHTTGHAA